jgi:hypothetical protein
MKLKALLFCMTFVFSSISLLSQTIWAGPTITFTKENNSDWKMEANQDRITDSVWITRGQDKGIFNIYKDTAYSSTTPTDTEWAFGTTTNLTGLVFKPFFAANGSVKPDNDKPMVMHIISEDIYINVTFKSWGASKSGGFSYQRSTPGSMNTANATTAQTSAKLYPNPASKNIKLSGITEVHNYTIYNHLGVAIRTGVATNNPTIDIQNLAQGVYHFQLEGGASLRFVKE